MTQGGADTGEKFLTLGSGRVLTAAFTMRQVADRIKCAGEKRKGAKCRLGKGESGVMEVMIGGAEGK